MKRTIKHLASAMAVAVFLFIAFGSDEEERIEDESASTTITAENTTSVDFTEPQNFGEEVLRALKEDDYEKMEKFLPTSSDLVYLEGVFLNKNSTESERQKLKDELGTLQKKRILESKELFEDARQEFIDQGITLGVAALKFKKIELSDVKQMGEVVYRANILIHFDYFGAEHILELDDCLKAERTWLLGDGVWLD
jgi:hypothetical protein